MVQAGVWLAERLSAGTAGAAVSVETGWRVKATESMADRAAPAVVQPRFVRPWLCYVFRHRVPPSGQLLQCVLCGSAD
jgi:hypothetical protein